MAAGLGFKTFTTGEVLTAADTNGYLMQGINVFASTAARNAAITSPQEGQFAFTKDTNSLWYYDGAAWVASGATGDIEGVTAGVGISGGGTSGTVTITNDMATTITASGDIVVGTGSGTYDNLPIGTTAQVLTADTTVSPYKVKWATPAVASSGMTLIKRSTFTTVANTGTTFDGMFSATYDTYLMVVEDVIAVTEADDFYFQFRYAGPTTQTSANKFAQSILGFGGTETLVSGGSAAQFSLCRNTGTATFPSTGQFYISRVGNASEYPVITGTSLETNAQEFTTFAGFTEVARTYTGFILSSASTNITGTVAVYGLAIA